MKTLDSSTDTSINRRDFIKLKSLLLLWMSFLNSFGINLMGKDTNQTIDYRLLDKILKLPFSDDVMKEIKLRVNLQKEYNIDANGNIHSLSRFIKEITNYIISKKNFNDFKLLSSIQDKQIDYEYMFNTTAKHNEVQSMKYLQEKLLTHKDNYILQNALEYAVKSNSFETTLHLMQQKIQLDDTVKTNILNLLEKEENLPFYKKISGKQVMMLPKYSKTDLLKKRKMNKKTFTFEGYYGFNENIIYDYLNSLVHNSLVDLYMQYYINEFDIHYASKKVYINTYSTSYPLDFIEKFETSLYSNGFNSWQDNLVNYCDLENEMRVIKMSFFREKINQYLYDNEVNIYEFINIEFL